jgi:hypothetical protein
MLVPELERQITRGEAQARRQHEKDDKTTHDQPQ